MEENNENAVIHGLQEDGFNIWLDRRPSHQNVTIRNQRIRRRRNPCCSYCREEGHNILRCNPPEKTRIIHLVNIWQNIVDGPYANTGLNEMKNIIHQQLDQEENLSIFMLYYVVLEIRNPNSTNFQSISSSKRKISDKVLNNRIDQIHRRGNQNQINQLNEDLEFERGRSRLSERSSRLRRILVLNRRILDLENQHSFAWNILTNLRDEQSIPYEEEIRYISSLLSQLNNQYFDSVESYRTDYNEDPELILFIQNRMDQFALATAQYAVEVASVAQQQIQKTIKINKQILLENEYESWSNIDCPVCYESVKRDDICITNCFHKFCYSCISQTLKTDKNQRCPCCRTQVFELVNKSILVENEDIKDIIIYF